MLDISKVKNPMLNFMPDIALRDPEAVYHEGVFYLYYTHVDVRRDDVTSTLHMCTSTDLVNWTESRELFGGPLSFCAPGNVFRHHGKWVMSFQSYPMVPGRNWGGEDSRLYLAESDDLVNWSEPRIMVAEGAQHKFNDSPRQIDPYVVLDGDRAWCFYKSVGELGLLVSDDGLQTWTEALIDRPAVGRGHMPGNVTVENPYVLRIEDEWWMFLSPCSEPRALGLTRSKTMTDWPAVEYLNFPPPAWGTKGPTAPAILDTRDVCGKWTMVFHSEQYGTSGHEAAMGIAFSDDLMNWDCPE
jgi:predicted GH43/DUF377 family glycosyl hydrolase